MNSVFVSTADLAITKTLYLYKKIDIKVVIKVQKLRMLEKKTGSFPIYWFEPIFSRMAISKWILVQSLFKTINR